MRISIRYKLFGIILAVILLFVLVMQLFSTFFLEGYYLNSKKSSLKNCLKQITEVYIKRPNSLQTELEKIENTKNFKIVMVDESFNDIFSTGPFKSFSGSENKNRFGQRIIMDNIDNFSEVPVIKQRTDNPTNLEFLSLFAKIKNNSGTTAYLIISTSIAAMNDSTQVANGVILILSIIVLVIGAVVIIFVTNKITKPLIKINEITNEMSHLNFKDKIVTTSKDEIGELGEGINHLSRYLEQTISELNSANEKLKSDLQVKDQIDISRKELISNVSHELKTPIALIGGYTEGLKVNVNNEEKDFYCDVIIEETQRMNKIVLNLLDLSQVEAGYIVMNKQYFSISQLIQKSISRYKNLLEEKDIILTINDAEDCTVFADEERIIQAFENYFRNAIHHIDIDKKQIAISIEKTNDLVTVSVFNTGIRIPDIQSQKIWDSFYKVDKARTREYGGTGLGLSIVKAIIQAHEGTYGFENCDEGVRFWFTLHQFDLSIDASQNPHNMNQ